MKRALVVSHASVLPVNQTVYAALLERDWDVRLVVPAEWRSEHGRFEARALAGLEGRVQPRRVLLAGRPQRHLYLTRAAASVRHERPDVVLVEEEPYSVPALQWTSAAHRRDLPSAVVMNENLDRALPLPARMIRRRVLSRAAVVIGRSPTACELGLRWGARASALVPYAVPSWEAAPHRNGAPFTVGFAGRLVPQKGVHDLVRAAARLEAPVRVLFVGDGPLRDELARTAPDGVEIAVISGVAHERMPDAYAQMDVLVLPSRTTATWAEQFGRAVTEALSCGVPVVGSDSGELPWLIGATGGGVVFPEGDDERLADALGLLRADAGLRARLAAGGRTAVERLFSAEAAAAALDDALSRAIELHRGRR